MEKDIEQNKPAPVQVKKQFDALLAKNMERLLGTSIGISELPLNLATISSLVLLAECESEIEGSTSNPPERYTRETFLNDLTDLGLDSEEDEKAAVGDMIEKGYIDIGPDGRFLATKPALSMAKLLDHAFPELPGMSLVAYLVQTVNEVLEGSKEMESAISRFDQTLKMHGAVLSRQTPGDRLGLRAPSSKVTAPQDAGEQAAQTKRLTLSEIFRARQAQKMSQRSPELAGEPRVLTATGKVEELEIKEVYAEGDRPAATAEVPVEDGELQGQEIPEEESLLESAPVEGEASYADFEISAEKAQDTVPISDSDRQDLARETPRADTVLEDLPSEQEMPLSLPEDVEQEKEISTETRPEESGTKADQAEEESPPAQAQGEEEIVSKEHEAVIVDEIIKERVAAFEEDLAMTCPVCNTGRVQRKETKKGKYFYACLNKGCIFISWGKPYHIVCPQCKNPFLIESTDKDGKTIFRCPRATCHHRQKPPWEMAASPPESAISSSQEQEPSKPRVVYRKPRKKVVRRRLVRRKR